MVVKFPGKMLAVARVKLVPLSITLEEVPRQDYTPWLTYPDFPELDKVSGVHGTLRHQGVDAKADTWGIKNELSVEEVTSVLRRALPDGYPTIMVGRPAVYDIMQARYAALESWSPLKIISHDRTFATGRISKTWFVNPWDEAPTPLKDKCLPRPYSMPTYWIGFSGQALLGMTGMAGLLDKYAGVIGDPYAWTTPEGATLRQVTIGEDA